MHLLQTLHSRLRCPIAKALIHQYDNVRVDPIDPILSVPLRRYCVSHIFLRTQDENNNAREPKRQLGETGTKITKSHLHGNTVHAHKYNVLQKCRGAIL
jgi:predicted metalloenzyme YecM